MWIVADERMFTGSVECSDTTQITHPFIPSSFHISNRIREVTWEVCHFEIKWNKNICFTSSMYLVHARLPRNTHDRKKNVQGTNPIPFFGILINEQFTFATNRANFFCLISSNASCTYADCILLARNPTRMYVLLHRKSLALFFRSEWEWTKMKGNNNWINLRYASLLHSLCRRSETNSQHTHTICRLIWLSPFYRSSVSLALDERVVWMRYCSH